MPLQKTALRILTESGKAKISCDSDQNGFDSTELFRIDICSFKDSISVEDGMVDAYNTYGMRVIIILFQIFDGISVQRLLIDIL